MPDQPKPFYLTTPIYYVNARPHIGHAYTTIVADVLARRHRLLGEEVYFLTGTDEHGQKIERSAAAAGIPPQQFADQVSYTFQALWARMGITHDQFIRTTDEKHIRGAQHLFRELHSRGHIYLDSYTGQYSIGEEMFVEGPPGTLGPDGKPTETVTEENFFFRLSAFQQPLLDLIESGQLAITPDSARNEVLSFIRSGLRDLSVSRSSFTWGIPVPEPAASESKQKHVIYVWLDALANYMTALGYGNPDDALWQKFWPADLHLVGKEITRFHCVYWPAFLLAAGLPLPKQVTANGWLLFDNAKMSKSKGNVVRTETILDAFGTLCPDAAETPSGASSPQVWQPQTADSSASLRNDKKRGLHEKGSSSKPSILNPKPSPKDLFAADILRYYLLREIPFGQDGSFSFDAMVTRYNADLANGYGNLVSRTLSMIAKYFDGVVPAPIIYPSPAVSESSLPKTQIFDRFVNGNASAVWSVHLPSEAVALPLAFDSNIKRFHFIWALQACGELIRMLDSEITSRAPWKVIPGISDEEMRQMRGDILYLAAESIRIITALLYPILPYATARVWQQLGLGDIELAAANGELNNLQWGGLQPGTKLGPLGPIFPRADKGLAQTMADIEEKLAATKETQIPSGNDKQEGTKETTSRNDKQEERTDSTHPAAPPRTSSLPEPAGPLTVGGSAAHTTGPHAMPSHTEAAASGIFAAAPSATSSDTIAIDDFIKIDLRVAEVVLAERIPKADKLLRLEVDLGALGRRQILSGIAEFYTPEELLGRRIIVIANLAPRKMRGLESHGMLLAASEEGGKPFLATVPEGVAIGTRLK